MGDVSTIGATNASVVAKAKGTRIRIMQVPYHGDLPVALESVDINSTKITIVCATRQCSGSKCPILFIRFQRKVYDLLRFSCFYTREISLVSVIIYYL